MCQCLSVPKIPQIRFSGQSFPVQGAFFRSKHSTQGFHKDVSTRHRVATLGRSTHLSIHGGLSYSRKRTTLKYYDIL